MSELSQTYGERGSHNKDDRDQYLALLIKCRDSMLEVFRLTGENVKLNQEITLLQTEVQRLKNLLDYIIDTQSRGG